MVLVGIVTLIMLVQYIGFTLLVGKQRVTHGIKAPATTGHLLFDRAYRVQMNTLEQLVIALPAMWLCGWSFSPIVAALLGLLFVFGRLLYALGYMSDPDKRGAGMGLGFLAYCGMIGCALWGLVGKL